jgi:hypothetical protein
MPLRYRLRHTRSIHRTYAASTPSRAQPKPDYFIVRLGPAFQVRAGERRESMVRRSLARSLWVLRWLLRTMTVIGLVGCVALFGVVVVILVNRFLNARADMLVIPAFCILAALTFAALLCRVNSTTLTIVLTHYVFVAPDFPSTTTTPGEPLILFVIIVLAGFSPLFGYHMLLTFTGVSVPSWLSECVSLLICIAGWVDAAILVQRRHPRIYADDPLVRKIRTWWKKRK